MVAHGGARDWPAYVKGHDEGNYVILEHAAGEHTEFRHLAATRSPPTSATACTAATCSAGAEIGERDDPHLHMGFLSLIDSITTRPMRLAGTR